MPELLADLTECDAETKRGNDVERAELQAEPTEGRHWLENEAVDFDDRSEKESHFRRVGVSETVRKSVVDAFLSLVRTTLARLAEQAANGGLQRDVVDERVANVGDHLDRRHNGVGLESNTFGLFAPSASLISCGRGTWYRQYVLTCSKGTMV